MANRETKLQIVVDAQNNTSGAFKSVAGDLANLSDTLKGIGTAGVVSLGALSTALAYSAREAIESESAQNRLTQLLKTSRDATDEQVQALLDQAEALQKVGVVAADNVIQTQAQLATFDLASDTIARLTPAILDYVVAEKGASATTDDFRTMTNGLAQALQGNFKSLTSVGFILDDTTRELISNGTEAQRSAALVAVLNSTYEGFNQTARETTEGSLVALKNELADIAQTIGETFIPVIKDVVTAIRPVVEQFGAWVQQNPEVARTVIIAALALTALLAVLLPIGIALPGIIIAFQGLAVAFAFITGLSAPMLLALSAVLVTLGYLITQGYLTRDAWQNVWLGIKLIAAEAANAVIDTVESMINFVLEGVNKAIRAINQVIAAAQKVPGIGKLAKSIKELSPVDLGSINATTVTANDLAGRSAPLKAANILQLSGNVFLSEDVAEKIGDLIMGKLKLSNAL